MTDLHVSPAGRAYIERKEGCRLEAYQDVAGIWTIGFGDVGADVCQGLAISQEEADARLTRRLADEFEPALNTLLGSASTTPGQFDAMASLAYNIGPGDWRRVFHRHYEGGFADSSVLREHLAGSYDRAADDFLLWDKAGGRYIDALAERRAEEGQAYLDASPGCVP